MKIDFYHWSAQCPLNVDMLNLFRQYEGRLEVAIHDITGNPALARQLRMYYPTLTVAGGQARYYSPLSPRLLDAFCAGEMPPERPYRPALGTRERQATVAPLTYDNLSLAGRCTGRAQCAGCGDKARFLFANGLTTFGFIHTEGQTLLGGAEFVPATLVPYDVPHDIETAFITCVYLSDAEWDCKSAPLHALERYLSQTFRRALVVSDEQGVFPNGDMAFFLRNGYADMGVVAREGDYCTLHLMGKPLR